MADATVLGRTTPAGPGIQLLGCVQGKEPGHHPPHQVFRNNLMATFNVVKARVRACTPRGVAGWPYIDALDLAEAVRRAVESDLPGHEVFFLAAPDTAGGHDLHRAWRAANPEAPTGLRPVARPDASGVDSGKAERMLGWRATRTWRD